MKIKCPSCKYEWETNSKLNMVTCPSCQLKVKVDKEVKHENKKKSTED